VAADRITTTRQARAATGLRRAASSSSETATTAAVPEALGTRVPSQVRLGAVTHEDIVRRWDRVIPHFDLTAELLPKPGAGWDELTWFAGTWDGYLVLPDVPSAIQQLIESGREQFRADGSLPDGLTMLRTALYAEQRADYWNEGQGPAAEELRYIHALVERIRELVLPSANTTAPGGTLGGVRDKVMNAYDRLLVSYAGWGGHRYHGWTDYADAENYLGPVIWSERDCGLRFAFELEREWPQAVHMEFAIGKTSRGDFDSATEKPQRVDVAVGDPSAFIEDETSGARFGRQVHELFCEVKWLSKGWRGNTWEHDARKRVAAIPVDLAKLAHHIALGRCAVAVMLVFDDEDYFAEHGADVTWPPGVWRLVVGPQALRRRGLLPDE
jgi:hypothetical protein